MNSAPNAGRGLSGGAGLLGLALALAGFAVGAFACGASESADAGGGVNGAGGGDHVPSEAATSGAGGAGGDKQGTVELGGSDSSSSADNGPTSTVGTTGPGGGEPQGAEGGGSGSLPECVPETVRYDASSDDSNSMASPLIARELLRLGIAPPDASLRTHEFLNHYHAGRAAPADGIAVDARVRPTPGGGPYDYDLEISVVAGSLSSPPPLFLTVALDASGSMKGTGLERGRAAVRAIAKQLRPEDRVTLLAWRETPEVLFEALPAVEARAKLEEALASVKPGGDSNLSEGVRTAFLLARAHHAAGATSRVVVISDGGANVSEETETAIRAEAARTDEKEQIYLVGVGVGPGLGYDDALMDALTDAGRGAYVYLDAPEAAEQLLGARFDEVMRVAARDVDVNVTLPDYFEIAGFSGEGISATEEQRDQHLAPGGAMLFALRLVGKEGVPECPIEPGAPGHAISVDVSYRRPSDGSLALVDPKTVDLDAPIGEEAEGDFLKTFAVFAYAEALRSDDPSRPGVLRPERLAEALALVQEARAARPSDPDLAEIERLIPFHPDLAAE